MKLILICVSILLVAERKSIVEVNAYLVGSGLNVRFGQLLYTDSKYQALREQLIKQNTRLVMQHCREDAVECEGALSKMKFKPSKHFYALAKAVVAYITSRSTAKPSGYVGTAMFCHDNTCIPDMDPPIVYGGCSQLISCGGNETWNLQAKDADARRLHQIGLKPVGKDVSSPKPEPDKLLQGFSGRRHMEECEPKPFPDDEKPVMIELPTHIDDNMYYVTTVRPYFTAGPIPAQGYHPPSTAPPDSCERIYQEFIQKQYSDSESELTKSEESIEFIRKPVKIRQ